MKNFDAKLFRELKSFTSNVRILLTGTPLQNNLRELWSLLNFLMPSIFSDWISFESWFDFTDLEDEERVDDFIENDTNIDLVQKMHVILRPLMLRRLKSDVLQLPPKREYVLYAPMVPEQVALYKALKDPKQNAREYLETKLADIISSQAHSTLNTMKPITIASRPSSKDHVLNEKTEINSPKASSAIPRNAFSLLMGKPGRGRPPKKESVAKPTEELELPVRGAKRKERADSIDTVSKSRRSSRQSTPSTSRRGRPTRRRSNYHDSDASDDDQLDDDEFEAKMAKKFSNPEVAELSTELDESSKYLEIARQELKGKKLGNLLVQLRLVCNTPHNFYDPFIDPNDRSQRLPVDKSMVVASGKMLLLDRLLPKLIQDGHRALIFSQFKTQLNILQDYCSDIRGWDFMRIDGGVSGEERQRLIDEFNSNTDYKVFLLSTRAGGQGLNLTGADTVILFDS